MEGVDLSKPVNGNWEVYKDAFAPPQPRTFKAWERAPVPAHAPRLQGQKIWKRAGIKSQREQDKENFDAAQKELAKEGNGARKRMRVCGGKENIGDAIWKDNTGFRPKETIMENGVAETTKTEADSSIPLNDSDVNALQFVPRKRTNANHVITPRKPLRQSTLNAQAQTQGFAESLLSSEKPVRRRKSMRKSIRKSFVGGIPDVPAAPVEEKSTIVESGTEVPGAVVVEKPLSGESVTAVIHPDPAQGNNEEPNVESSLNDKLNKLFDFTDDDIPIAKESKQPLDDEANHPLTAASASDQVVQVQLNNLQEISKERSCQAEVKGLANEGKQPVYTEDEPASRSRQALEMQPAILNSIEAVADAYISTRPAKTTYTPKKKRGTSQRRGTRRSTRTTRASSVRPEEQAAPEVNGDQSVVGEPKNHTVEIAPDVVEEPEEAETRFENEPAIEKGRAAESKPLCESEPVTVTEPAIDNEVKDSVDIKAPGAPIEHVREMESFDVSARPILEYPAINQEQNTADEDFELPPAVLSPEDASLNESREAVKPEISTLEATLLSSSDESPEDNWSAVRLSPAGDQSTTEFTTNSKEFTVEILETLEPISIPNSGDLTNENDTMSPPVEDLPETSTPDPTTSELVEAISENAPLTTYDNEDTDLLRNFLTRVKANKEAKAGTHIHKRKRSLPHSPLRLPLGEADADISPSDPKMKDEFDVGLPGPSPSKRQKRNDPETVDEDDTITERKPTRRSGRTRLPVVKTPLGAPSHIPVRRLGQDGDTTVTLKRSEEKELAALTRVNTRKNKGASQSVPDVLAKKAEEKEDPVLRQRLLKEVFNEKANKGKKGKKVKTVIWAEELTQYQTVEARKLDGGKEKEKETQNAVLPEEKKSAVKVGIRSKIALGMAANGTPAPKRKKARS